MYKIAVVTGGEASELEISLKSAGVVYKHLDRTRFEPYRVELRNNHWMCQVEDEFWPVDKNDFTVQLPGKSKLHFDAVFLAIHGTPAEDGKLQAYFDLLHIPYSACGVLPAVLSFDKMRCKQYLSAVGIPTAKAKVLLKKAWTGRVEEVLEGLPLPLFVKPNKNGSSFGAGMADTPEKLGKAIDHAFEYDDEVVVEEYLKGTEVTCGVIRKEGKLMALPVTEIRSKKEFFDFEAKYKGFSEEITPAEIGDALTKVIQDLSVKCYSALGFKGMCRVDFIIRDGQAFMLEVNAIPGLSEESIIPQQARAVGISLQQLFTLVLEEALTEKA